MSELSQHRVVLYVRSFLGSRGMVDRGTISFSCRCDLKHWDSLKSELAGSSGRFFSDDDWRALQIAERLQQDKNIAVKVIDVGLSAWRRLRSLFRGIGRTPRFYIDDKPVPPITSVDHLIGILS